MTKQEIDALISKAEAELEELNSQIDWDLVHEFNDLKLTLASLEKRRKRAEDRG